MDPVVLARPRGRGERGERRPAAKRTLSLNSLAELASHANRAPELPNPAFLFGESVAKLVTDESGRVVWTSPGADRVTSDNACIGIENGQLYGRTRCSDSVLRELFSSVRIVDRPVEKLLATSAEEIPQLFVRAEACRSNGAHLTAFTIRRLDRDVRDIPDLHRLYGLTKTEQQIVRQMIQGQSVREIAAEMHKSVLTVRTHVKRIYTKLNVGSKEQLFSRVMKLMVD